MAKNTHLAHDKIAQISALKESVLQTKDKVAQLGVSERSVRRWFAKFNQKVSQDTPTHEKWPGSSNKKQQSLQEYTEACLRVQSSYLSQKIEGRKL